MKNSSRSSNAQQQSIFLQLGFLDLASQQAGQDLNEEQKIAAGSGRRLLGCFDTSTPLGRFSKILLESETWASPEFSLRWKLKVTKCGCIVFQLAPSARRIDASGTGSWPTPAKRDEKGQTQNPERMDYVPNIVRGWATPKRAPGGPDFAIANREESGGTSLPTQATGPISSGCLARTEKFVVRLEILSAWLMAYPWSYLKNWERKGDRRRKTASRTEASSGL